MASETKFKETEIGMIPEEWNTISIDKVKSENHYAVAMGPFGSNITKDNFIDSGVPVIRGGNIEDFRFNEEDFVHVSEEKAEELKASSAVSGDIVITHRGTLGQVGIIPENSKYSKYIVSQSQMKLTCNEKIVNPFFVYYFLKSKKGQYLLLRNKSQTGVPAIARPTTSLKEIKIPLPLLEEQNSIVDTLRFLDNKIELNRQMNKTLEQIAQTLFKHWFIDFEFPDENGNPYKSSGGRMVDSELGEIPEGWGVKKVDEILELAYGKALKEDIRIPGSTPVYGSNGQVGWHNQKLVDGPGIVVGRKGNPGTVNWVHTHFYPIDTTFYVIPKNLVRSLYYLLYALKKQDLPSLAADSAVPGLNRNMVYMNKMIVPKKNILDLFDVYLNNIYQKIQVNEEQSRVLGSIRDSLLPKLMSGKIRVQA
ncbi:MAG: restriction endonuclease subunit S [Methanosarcina sp.]|nr:restriction endonuclease subunit S [Methanosarcina sp.]